ncbi:unnamed protein product [Victoria cruziana]
MATATAIRRAVTSRAHLLRCSRFSDGLRSSSFNYYHSIPIYHSVQKPEISHSCTFFHREFQRGFAKGRKSKDDNDTVEVIPDIGPTVKSSASLQMEAAIDALSRELSKLRTGRASAGMLDHIVIETHAVKSPLSRLAVVSVIDSHTLSVTPYDPDSLKELERGIASSPLGLNPSIDGQRLIAAVPP